MIGSRQSKFVILAVVGVLLVFFLITNSKSIIPWYTVVDMATLKRIQQLNRTLLLERKYPEAACRLPEVVLTDSDFLAIKKCVGGYSALEKTKINHVEMESNRVLLHKPWLSLDDSLMIEVGGYTGVDAQRLLDHGMHPYYIMLEPVPNFYKLLVSKFKNDDRFKILNYGLGRTNHKLTIPVQTDATSLFRGKKIPNGTKTVDVQIRKSTDFFDEVGVQKKNADLLHINCEGCEFELLEDLISTGYIQYFNHIQFQFHMHLPYINKEACRYCQIMHLLKRTHKPMFQYRHTWQAWEIIS